MSQNDIKNRALLAQNVNTLREKSNIKREELSLILGLDNSYISKLEKGKMNITIDKLTLIADYFNVNLEDLFRK